MKEKKFKTWIGKDISRSKKKLDLSEIISRFDRKSIVKQIILIGLDGRVRNIEFEIKDDKEVKHE